MANTNTPQQRRQRFGDEELDDAEEEPNTDVSKPLPVSGGNHDSKMVKGKGKQSKQPEKAKAVSTEGPEKKEKQLLEVKLKLQLAFNNFKLERLHLV